MKICSICLLSLALDQFDVQSTGAMGRRADCKECRKRFNRTKEGVVALLYSTQRAKSKKRGHPAPAYTRDQLFTWLWAQPTADTLYKLWELSGYDKDLKPSVDRLDDYLPYQLDNIRLIPWGIHRSRYASDAIAGLNTKTCVAVDQYTLDGVFVKTFHSYKDAARSVNGVHSNIRNVATGAAITRLNKDGSSRSYTPTSAYGFLWKLN